MTDQGIMTHAAIKDIAITFSFDVEPNVGRIAGSNVRLRHQES